MSECLSLVPLEHWAEDILGNELWAVLCPKSVLPATPGREGTFPKLLGLSLQLKVALLVSVGTLESRLPLAAPRFLLCGLEVLKMFSPFSAKMDSVL